MASLAGVAGLSALWPSTPPPPAAETRVDATRSTKLLLAIDLAVLAGKDYVREEDSRRPAASSIRASGASRTS